MRGLALLPLLMAGTVQAGCLDDPDPCTKTDGIYHIALPQDAEAPPVVVFLHGAGGTGGQTLRNAALRDAVTARGYALIAPTGSRGFGGGKSWNFLPGWEGRDEGVFLRQVVDDAAERFGTDADRVLLAGFSAGAFMVYYTACADPGAFPAYAPVAGGFWRPQPTHCAGPVDLFHTHGWTDRVVPLEGRELRAGEFIQGDIWAGLELWRDTNGCDGHDPDSSWISGDLWRRSWACETDLQLALFPGGHRLPAGWSDLVLDWFETLE